MKDGQEALSQYDELAEALRQLNMGWVVAEVEEVISRGKMVPFRDLSQDQQMLYEYRLSEEERKGFRIGRAKAGDMIGVPYRPEERLALLVSATERVVATSAQSYAYVSSFGTRHNLHDVILEQPVGADIAATSPERREVSLSPPSDSDVDERLSALNSLLNENVLD